MPLIGIMAFSQIKYEKAYFITNSDTKVECLIRNVGWKSNPTSFEYKVTENDVVKTNTIKDVKAFEIYNQIKFVRSTVKVDQSSVDLSSLSTKKEPEYKDEELFLKQLEAGDISLYSYYDGATKYFYYQVGSNNAIEPLVYKPYKVEDIKLRYNEDYKTQLSDLLVCSSITSKDIDKLQYKESYITDLFVKYYHCSNDSYETKTRQSNEGKFNLNLRPRVNFVSADVTNYSTKESINMGSKTSFGFGVEAEYVLPFNKNKWSIILEPTYQSYKSNKEFAASYVVGQKLEASVDYKSIEVPVGIRYYMFIDDKSKIFVNAQYVLDLHMNSKVELTREDGSVYNSIPVKTRPNFALGAGYNYKSKYTIEARFFTNRDLLGDYLLWEANYKSFSLILSYNLF